MTGMINDGFAVAQSFKAPGYGTIGFAGPFLFLSYLMFFGVIARWFFQRAAIREMADADRGAVRVSNWVALINLVFVLSLVLVLVSAGSTLAYTIPFSLKLVLLLPFLIVLGAIYHAYQAVQVWRGSRLGGVWARVRYTLISLAALFIAWFFYYWNLVGFNYFS